MADTTRPVADPLTVPTMPPTTDQTDQSTKTDQIDQIDQFDQIDLPSDLLATLRPRLRGRLHLLAAVVSLVALAWLVRSASTWQAKVAAWIYGVSCLLLYATSTTYHVFAFARSDRVRKAMQSLDHSMIYFLIAGTFTPICILAMDGPWRWVLLAVVWAAAGLGAVRAIAASDRFRGWGFALYLVMGWAGLVAIPALIDQPSRLVLMIIGGVLYTVGAVLFSLHRPRLSPRWFGYHEVWHALGITAGALFFVVNLGIINGVR